MAPKLQRRPAGMRLAHQFWLSLVVPIAMAIALYGLFSSAHRKQVLRQEATAELRNYATLLQAFVESALQRRDIALVRRRAEHFASAERIQGVAAFTREGEAVFITEGVKGEQERLEALARRAFLEGGDIEERTSLVGQPVLVRTVAIHPSSANPPLVAVLVRDRHYIEVLESSLNRGLAATGVVLLLVSAVVAGVVGRFTVALPARAILSGAERVASGDLDAAVPEKGAEELSRLAHAFNTMTWSLREARGRAEREEMARVNVERRLQQAQALAAAGQVATSLGHEIGSPLNVIQGRARRAADLPGCPEHLRAELETIARQSERITRVVSRLVSLARPSRQQQGDSDLRRVVDDVVAFLGPECKKRDIETSVECPRDSGSWARVALDSDRLFQVVFNLCLNAIEAQDGGGELVVRVLPEHDGPAGSRAVCFEVEDAGPGVRAEDLGQIFEPFFTTKSTRGGSGLGLAIVHGIVQEAGGSVEVSSSPTGGARFRVTLPTEAPDSPSSRDASSAASSSVDMQARQGEEASSTGGEGASLAADPEARREARREARTGGTEEGQKG
ncbi:ATP-binding protein [Sorangium sp. So ce394]|uniref:sensor histidine kinase n=1 Tax=Sorangium sp. So ce394 TaxID=3133310 RepID=UPI003F5AFFF5